MARRRRPEKRIILPDPKFGDEVLSKFMNSVMLDGKKSVAELIVYGALETVEQRAKREPVGVFHDALNNIKPGIEVRSRRVGGATYQVPVEVRPERAQALAIRWLITAARNRSENTMSARLSGELRNFGVDGSTSEAVVTFDAALIRTTGEVVEKRRFEARVPIAAIEANAASQGINQAANQVAGQVADWVGK